MTIRSMIRVLGVLLLIEVSACGPSSSHFEDNVVQGVPNGTWSKTGGSDSNPFMGSWVTQKCNPQGENSSSKVELRTYDDRTLLITIYYRDGECKLPLIETILVFNSTPEQVDLHSTKISTLPENIMDHMMVPLSTRTATEMNSREDCKFKGWAKNRSHSVRGSNCQLKELGMSNIYIQLNTANHKYALILIGGIQYQMFNRMTGL